MAKKLSQRLRAQVHIAKKQLGLNDETYRAALVAATGLDSTRGMGVYELSKAVDHFKSKGFKNKASKRKYSPKTRNVPKGEKDQSAKLRALWIAMFKDSLIRDGSEAALCRWVQRMTKKYNGVGWQNPEWVPAHAMIRLIEDLKQWQQRLEAAQEATDNG